MPDLTRPVGAVSRAVDNLIKVFTHLNIFLHKYSVLKSLKFIVYFPSKYITSEKKILDEDSLKCLAQTM